MLPIELIWIFCLSSFVAPNNFIQKILISKNFIHFTLDIVTRVPVAVNIDTSCILENSLHLPESSIEPGEIGWHTILEYITE